MDIYADNILDHFRHPRHHGALQNFTTEHEERNVECGDVVKVWLKLDPLPTLPLTGGGSEGGGAAERECVKISRIGWTGTGCAISQASMSILSEEIEGKSEEDIQAMSKDDVYALLGVPIGPRRFKCALMGLHAVKNALRKARGLTPQDWVATVAME